MVKKCSFQSLRSPKERLRICNQARFSRISILSNQASCFTKQSLLLCNLRQTPYVTSLSRKPFVSPSLHLPYVHCLLNILVLFTKNTIPCTTSRNQVVAVFSNHYYANSSEASLSPRSFSIKVFFAQRLLVYGCKRHPYRTFRCLSLSLFKFLTLSHCSLSAIVNNALTSNGEARSKRQKVNRPGSKQEQPKTAGSLGKIVVEKSHGFRLLK